MVSPRHFSLAAILLTASTISARAVDEIQVYNAEIAKVGQWTFQLHNNYAFMGRKEPDFPGGLVPNHALNGTGEWAWGITDWWEMGFYTPYAVDQELTPYSNAAKIRFAQFGWQAVPRVYAVALLVTAVIFWLLSAPDTNAPGKSGASLRQQLAVFKDLRVWKYCQYYSIVFGGFTALSVWMPQYFVSEYGLSIAQASLLAACFSLPAGILRAAGGWLADRFGAHDVTWWVLWAAWISLFLLSYPQTDFIIHTIRGPAQFHIGLSAAIFTMLLFALGVAFAFGMASTFKYVGDDFPDNMGIVTGIVGLAGGLGGFLLPVLFGAILDWLGINSSCFMFLYGIVWVSLILNYTTEVRRLPVMGERALLGATVIPPVAAVAAIKTGARP